MRQNTNALIKHVDAQEGGRYVLFLTLLFNASQALP